MSKIKVTVDTPFHGQNVFINVGANSGYVEAYLTKRTLSLVVYNKNGDAILQHLIPITSLKATKEAK